VKTCSKCKEPKAVSEFHKSKGKSDGLQSQCIVCHRESKQRWAAKNKDSLSAYHKAWYKDNREHKLANNRAWYESNRELKTGQNKAWAKANPDKRNADAAKRRALKRGQTPELTTEEKAQIEHIYWMAQDCRAVSGEVYHVDHIKPISKGGLHHPNNLQVMYWQDNLRKGAS
jgi:hypothetical protein